MGLPVYKALPILLKKRKVYKSYSLTKRPFTVRIDEERI